LEVHLQQNPLMVGQMSAMARSVGHGVIEEDEIKGKLKLICKARPVAQK
jgi:hypothetical protein